MPSSATSRNRTLFHLGYTLPEDLPLLIHLRSTRYVLLCGSINRAYNIAAHFHCDPCENLCRTDRYTVLNPIPGVLIVAHGIGAGSVDAALHELYHLLTAVDAEEGWGMIRVGSCGGVGVDTGSIIVTDRMLNGGFEEVWRIFVLGKEVCFPAKLSEELSDALFRYGQGMYGEKCKRGDTLSAETFYLAQGRTDGAFADFTAEDRGRYLDMCREKGVRNFEMEGLALAAFGEKVGVPTAVVCGVLVNRCEGEMPEEGKEALREYEERAVKLVVGFVEDKCKECFQKSDDCGDEG